MTPTISLLASSSSWCRGPGRPRRVRTLPHDEAVAGTYRQCATAEDMRITWKASRSRAPAGTAEGIAESDADAGLGAGCDRGGGGPDRGLVPGGAGRPGPGRRRRVPLAG